MQYLVLLSDSSYAQSISINNNKQQQSVSFGNSKLKFVLNYDHQCNVSYLEVNGQKVIDGTNGIYSEIQTGDKTFSTLQLAASPVVAVVGNIINISGIAYGDNKIQINETWKFLVSDTAVKFFITRKCPKEAEVESASFPAMEFNSINTWEGAFQGFGGIAWFYLFNEKLCTYGDHTNEASFWNSKTNNGLNISVDAPGKQVAMKYTRTDDDKLAYSISVSEKEMIPRYDSGTHRRRFIARKQMCGQPFKMLAGTVVRKYQLFLFRLCREIWPRKI